MPRLIPALTVMAALAGPAAALDLEAMTDEQRALFREEVRAYLLENPEIIMEAVAVLEAREAEAQARTDLDLVKNNASAIFDDGYSWVGGNPDGDITLVEFIDYRCGFCKRAHGEVAKILEFDGNVRLITKELPILGEQSVLASRFAVATKQLAGDDAYKGVSDALMTQTGAVDMRSLRRMASTFGLDADAIEAHMNSPEVSDEIRKTRALAQQLNISGTPTFVLQDELLRGFLPFDQMMELIEEKRG